MVAIALSLGRCGFRPDPSLGIDFFAGKPHAAFSVLDAIFQRGKGAEEII
jgi:hypothetical protein